MTITAISRPADTGRRSRQLRSFVRREGRMTPAQKKALAELWDTYGIDNDNAILEWGSLFGDQVPVTVEIGFGDGKSLQQLASHNPTGGFLGIEPHRSGAGQLLMNLHKDRLNNVKVIVGDAAEVFPQRVRPDSVDRILVFFPDPWPKKRHHKRRLLDPGFLDILAGSLKPDGLLHVATDWGDYANQILTSVDNNPNLINQAGVGHFSERPTYRPQTKYEMRGLRLGHTVNDIVARRNP